MPAHRSFARHGILGLVVLLLTIVDAGVAMADEFWVAATSQQDVGGLEIASNGFWPVTPAGAVRFAFSVPNDLLTFQSAKVVLIPHAPGGASTLNVFVCPAQNGGGVVAACAGPIAQPFTGVTNQLAEVDITAVVAPKVGTPGATYLAVVAYTTPTTTTDHVVGLRFRYAPVPPANVATLGANTFTGIQTAPSFVGDGTNVSGVNATLLDGLDSTQFSLSGHGHDVSQITNAARLAGGNTLSGTQTIDGGNVDLDASSAAAGNVTKNGVRFLHNFGVANTFLGASAGNFTLTGDSNTAVGFQAFFNNTTGSANTAVGVQALVFNGTGTGNTALGGAALQANTTGVGNTATGVNSLAANVDGHSNTSSGHSSLRNNSSGAGNSAFGLSALHFTTTGNLNTAAGWDALRNNSTGSSNAALGWSAGSAATTGSNNIYLGAGVVGVAGESNAIYLGTQGLHTRTVIGGIRGTSVVGGEMVVIDASGRLGTGPVLPGANSVGTNEVIDDSLSASDLAPNSVGTSELAADSVTAAKVAFNYAGSTTEGGSAANADLLDGLDSTAFARLTANTFAATQTINGGNLDLDSSTSTIGNITKNGTRFLHNFGNAFNLFLGEEAGNFTMTGANNTAVGRAVLSNNTNGFSNTAVGLNALFTNSSGSQNAALGWSALSSNTSGATNAAFGFRALVSNNVGGANTAAGFDALNHNTTGSNNVGVGALAGFNGTTGSNNIYLGANVTGVAAESNTIYIGLQGTQLKTIIAGIRGRTTGVADAIPVLIDSNGQLGTMSSSRRFKEDIQDMAGASDRLFRLHPVTFRYIEPYANGSKPIQFGLIAEEVADVFPELAVRNADGVIETVHYETLNVLLLNEVQKQQRELEAQRDRIATLERRVNELIVSR